MIEGFFGDDGGEFGADAHGLFVFVDDENFVGLAHGFENGFFVERRQGAQVDDFGFDAALGHGFGGFERDADHVAVGNDREIGAFTANRGFADGHGVIAFGDLALDRAIQALVLEEKHGRRIADRGEEQTFGVVRRRGHDHFDAGLMHEPRGIFLRVIQAAAHAAAAANARGEGAGVTAGAAVMDFRGLLDELIHRRRDEIGELNFGHRSQAHHRAADGRSDDDAFGERRIEDAVFAVLIEQARGGFENAAGKADIFAEDEDAFIASQFLIERLGNRFNESERASHRSQVSFRTRRARRRLRAEGRDYPRQTGRPRQFPR